MTSHKTSYKISCKMTGLGDVLLEQLLGIALEETNKEVGMPDDNIIGMIISAIKLSNNTLGKKTTVCFLQHIVRALGVAGWSKGK